MKSFRTKTNEVARVFTDSEWAIIKLALKEFKNTLPQARGECE
jgi:hypothetical protein